MRELIPSITSRWIGLLALCSIFSPIAASSRSFDSAITFNAVFPKSGDCSLIYGSLDFSVAGKDFIVEDCNSSWRILKSFQSIGFIKRMQFIDNDTAWGIVGGSIVVFEFRNDEIEFNVVKRRNDELYFESIYFLDERYGWACGRNGLIVRTVDGGRTWTSVATRTKADIIDIGFVDTDFGWAAVNSNEIEEFLGGYLETKDGGRSWESVPLPKQVSLSPLIFTSRNHGCGLASRSEIFCTFNGRDWAAAKLSPENRAGFHFIDDRHGWHVGSSIMRTTDGGKTWHYSLQDEDEKNRAFSGLNLDDVVFANNKKGWAWGSSSVYKTTDGGETWIKVSDSIIEKLKNRN